MPVKFECYQSGCSFMVRADSEDELVYLVKEHAQRTHDLSLEGEAIRSEIERP